MTSRLEELYKQMILEHNKNPRHFHALDPHTHHVHGVNPLCGDDYQLYLKVENGVIEDIGFEGQGCAISKSSGSILSTTLKGLPTEDALEIKTAFIEMLTKDKPISEKLGRLKVFEGVKKYPIRVKCATLIWRALESALETDSIAVSTE